MEFSRRTFALRASLEYALLLAFVVSLGAVVRLASVIPRVAVAAIAGKWSGGTFWIFFAQISTAPRRRRNSAFVAGYVNKKAYGKDDKNELVLFHF